MSGKPPTDVPRKAELAAHDWQLLVESVVDHAIFMLDPEGRVTTWNRGAEKIKGYSAGEIIGHHFSRFYPAADLEAGKPERELAIARDVGHVEDEGWRLRKDGTLFWANVVISAVRDDTGSLRGFSEVTRDLTRRRLGEQQLREAERRFHQLVDGVTDYAIFMLDLEGRVATWNSGAVRAKGYEASEIIGKHFSVFYPPEARAAGKPASLLAEVRARDRAEDEGWRVRKDGTRFWGNVVISAVRDEANQLVGFAKVTRDLTERRSSEEALRRSEERFRLLVDGVTDYALYMLDAEGRVATWNAGAQRMKGYAPDEIIGRSFAAFFSQGEAESGKPAEELSLALANGRFEAEGWRVRKDGSQFWANVVLTPIQGGRGELVGFAKVTRDLTSRREAEAIASSLVREQAAREAAEDANRLKDEFLATVSHELRTPLNAVLGWASLLRERPADGAALSKGLETIHRNALAQARIIDDILDVSRIITGKLLVDSRPTDLGTVAEEAIEVVRPSAGAKGITITFRRREHGIVLGDVDRLRQVAWNLLSNAVKFTDRGGRVEVEVEQDAANVVLVVRDTGRGIEPELLPYVFDRFRQGDSSTTRRFGGLGLGLAIVRHIVELHGGHARVESAGAGRGAVFRVAFPRAARAEAVTEVRSAPAPRSSSSAALDALRVLVVDDDDDARELLRMVLADVGAVVETAGSVAAAVDALGGFRPDVIVSDIGMADEDGYSFLRRVRATGGRASSIPALALTAYTREEDRRKALAAGFTAHVGKPVAPHDLVEAVTRMLAGRHPRGVPLDETPSEPTER